MVLCQKNNELKSLLSEKWNSAFLGLLFVSQFQETVAMVAKQQNGEILIDLIYLATCLSAAAVIPNKNPETIVKNIFEKWLSLYVEPQKFLTDNRWEFINAVFLGMAEQLLIEAKATAAESAWSKGVAERHNSVIGDILDKILADTSINYDIPVD